MLREKLKNFSWTDSLLILGIVLVIAGIGMNFKDSFWEKAEVKLTTPKASHLGGEAEPKDMVVGGVIGDVQSNNKVMIDVGGEVVSPGVYELSSEKRVNDALIAAGGLAAGADRDWVEKKLNKAERLIDGQKIYIPKVGEVLGESVVSKDGTNGVSGDSKVVRINTATIEQLDTLSGIGPAIAQRIIDYRSKNGGFKNVEELKLVSGIGDKLFEKIKDDIAL